MSAGSARTAIVSLGMSCQSARQIRTAQETLSRTLGEEIVEQRHFFDGLIAPPAGVAQLFADGFPLFRRQDIEAGPGAPVWQPYGIRFLHHFRAEPEAPADIDGYFDNETSRFSHLRSKFLKLAQCDRLIFVISNSQNNLTEVAELTHMPSVDFRQQDLQQLQLATNRLLGRKAEFLMVTYPERSDGVALDGMYQLDPDASEWTGDKRQWRALFRNYLNAPAIADG